jgi:hypothetical protein
VGVQALRLDLLDAQRTALNSFTTAWTLPTWGFLPSTTVPFIIAAGG